MGYLIPKKFHFFQVLGMIQVPFHVCGCTVISKTESLSVDSTFLSICIFVFMHLNSGTTSNLSYHSSNHSNSSYPNEIFNPTWDACSTSTLDLMSLPTMLPLPATSVHFTPPSYPNSDQRRLSLIRQCMKCSRLILSGINDTEKRWHMRWKIGWGAKRLSIL